MQKARGSYFVNRYGTFWKEENFNFPENQHFLKFIKKPGGRAGLRKFARAMRSMFGSVRAARALQDVSMCLSTALARKSSW